MIETIQIVENQPFPNNPQPVLFYPEAFRQLMDAPNAAQKVLAYLEESGYTNGWVNGIFSYHHFHSNTHEVLACIAGEASVQLGGPDAGAYRFKRGDVLLLPAGTAHKLVTATYNFRVVGAYPDDMEPDMQRGDAPDYEQIKANIALVPIPRTDPVYGSQSGVLEYW